MGKGITKVVAARKVHQTKKGFGFSSGSLMRLSIRSVVTSVLGGVAILALSLDTRADTTPEPPGAGVIARVIPSVEPKELLPIPGASPKAMPFAARPEVDARGRCGKDMVEVEGDYCPYVYQRCLRWIDPKTKLQCAEFAPSSKCLMPTQKKHFCIDKYEWPNKAGEKPVFMASWVEAKDACAAVGKRLCADTEWTLACEGPAHLPYPYGLKRDPAVCNIDKPYPMPRPDLVYNPETQADELARLDQREPSGARTSCTSPFGVRDMAGNVDEWVVNETQNGKPYKSGLKGGYWGPVRTRCRPMTTGHEETFRYYQIGFRCCGDASPISTSASPIAEAEATPPKTAKR